MSNKRISRSLYSATFLCAATCSVMPAFAADGSDGAQIEEIVVTANRRESNLQDTPVAVSAFTQASLDQAQVGDLAGLQSFVPNLTVEQHGDSGGVHVYLRGVGSANHTELGDPAVAFHVDEVYSPRPQGATVMLHDLEQVEVLRGPQGTLFGRNSTAGTVNLITAKPKLDGIDASADIMLGDYDRIGTRGMLNLPLGETFGLRAAVATDRHDGYVDFQPRSAVSGRKYGAGDQTSVRLTALFEPSEAWTFTGSVDYFDDEGTGNIALMQTPRPGQKRFSALVDTAGFLDQENMAYRLRADFRPTDNIEVSYIGGWAELERRNASDNDGGVIPGFKQEHRTEFSKFESYSHELSAKSTGDSKLQWIAGAYVMHEDNKIRFDIDISRVAPPPDNNDPIIVNPTMPDDVAWALSFIQPKRTLDSQALFAQGTLGLTDSLRVTAGARYTEEEKEDIGGRNFVCPNFGATIAQGGRLIGAGGAVTPETCGSVFAPGTFPGGGANDGKTSDNKTTWLARLEYDVNPDLLTYVSVSTGFKSGGLSDGGRRHLPEELTNYEVGLKSEFGRSLTVNLSAFFMDYQDMQVSAVERLPNGQQQLVTSNAASASIKGLEAEFAWRPSANDVLSGFASFLNAEFDEFNTIDTTYFNQGDLGNTVNLAGRPLRHAPDFSFTGTYEHKFTMPGGGALVPRLSLHYETDTIISAFNDVYPDLYQGAGAQDAYTQTDVSLRYEAAKGNWTVEAFVQNLEDEEVKTDIQNVGSSSDGTPAMGPSNLGTWLAFYNPPRTYGARFHINF